MSRQQQALREVGRTALRPRVAWALAALFLATAGAVPLLELAGVAGSVGAGEIAPAASALGRAGERLAEARPLAASRLLLEELDRIERLLDERSLLQRTVVPYAQWLETAVLGDGNRRALLGGPGGEDAGRWLFYRPDVEHLLGRGFLEPESLEARRADAPSWKPAPHPDPRPALAALHGQLAARGIELLVVPTPVKPMIHPERFSGRLGGGGVGPPERPLRDPSTPGLLRELRESGIAVLDPAPVLVAAREESGDPQYLASDTHWTPEAMGRVARALAAEIEALLGPPAKTVRYLRQPVTVSGTGDLVRMLRLPEGADLFRPQEVTSRMVTTPAGALWSPERGAPVLLLGDSFTNVFSQDGLGWGRSAGLAEQLSYHLGRPVDRIAINAGGSHTTREALARALRADSGRLDGVRLVVYQFAARELSQGDWRPVELPAPERAGTDGGEAPAEEARPTTDLGEGFAVWESNRTGAWRLWTARLDGSGLRQLTRDEPGRQHCCPHIAPDGSRLVYLSREAPADRYPEEEPVGELRVLELGGEPDPGGRDAGAGERVVAEAARTYGRGNRAAVWRSEDELAHVAADGRAVALDLARGTARELTAEPPDEPATGGRGDLGWLVDATLRHATSGLATFSVYDAEARRVLERRDLGGCEPYFSHDGRWGFWVPGAGGPIDRIDLASREVSTILDKNDPRLEEKGYLYFPMLSRDGHLFAFGASAGEHSHFEADYDVYVARTDPETLEILGRPVRITDHPATDRYPDVFQTRPPPDGAVGSARVAEAREAAPEPDEPDLREEGWPVRRDSLVFLWQTGDSPNLVDDPETGGRRAYGLEPENRARLDHAYRMVLDRGAYVASRDAARRLLDAAVASNELTVEATVVADEASFEEGGPMRRILTFSSGMDARNLTLGQQGSAVVVRLRTGVTGPNADRPQLELFDLEPGRPTHVAFTYSPGRLVAYRDGERVLESDAVTGSFTFHWKPRPLRFGSEVGGGGDWRGLVEGVAIHARELSADAIAESAKRYRAFREARPTVPRWRVRARLRATSEVPTLSQISPYRRALAVYEYRVRGEAERLARPGRPGRGEPESSSAPSGILRVARWVLLDGTVQPEASLTPGSGQVLVLEPYDANPQLGDVYLSDTLPPSDEPLYYSVEP